MREIGHTDKRGRHVKLKKKQRMCTATSGATLKERTEGPRKKKPEAGREEKGGLERGRGAWKNIK